MEFFKEEVVKEFREKVLTFDGWNLNSHTDYITLFSASQYKKFLHNYSKNSTDLTLETFEDYPYGIVLASGDVKIQKGEYVFFKPMTGFKIHPNTKYDVYITLVHKDDWLLNFEEA